jgi:hypothetical protein
MMKPPPEAEIKTEPKISLRKVKKEQDGLAKESQTMKIEPKKRKARSVYSQGKTTAERKTSKAKRGEEPKSPQRSKTDPLYVGQRVLASWHDGCRYSGKIARVHGSENGTIFTYDVSYFKIRGM